MVSLQPGGIIHHIGYPSINVPPLHNASIGRVRHFLFRCMSDSPVGTRMRIYPPANACRNDKGTSRVRLSTRSSQGFKVDPQTVKHLSKQWAEHLEEGYRFKLEMVSSPGAFSGSSGQQISGLPQPVAHSYGWLAGWLFDRRLWDRCSHATAIRSGAAAAAAPGSSTQRGTRVSREEAFDLLGSFLGCLLRISPAQLASLDSVRDRLIDLRWNPRLTSTGQQCPVLK